MEVYDLIIVGVGPAGLAASIYASRYKLSNLVIGKELGGELALAHKIENYPGYISISGLELCGKFKEQAEALGAKVLLKEVGKISILSNTLRSTDSKFFSSETRSKKPQSFHQVKGETLSTKKKNLEQSPRMFEINISGEEKYRSRALIVATGSERRRLNIPGEKEYMGKGVSYCYTCDAPFFKDKIVALVGGADSAVSGAVHAAEYAKKVYIIYRKDQLRAEPAWIEEWKKIEQSGKGTVIYGTNIIEILGDGSRVIGVKLDKGNPGATAEDARLKHRHKGDKGDNVLKIDGVFIEIGGVPGTTLVQSLGVKLDETGHAVVGEGMETNISGLFCAGDMTDKSKIMKQAITAEAQGAIAASSAYKFIKKESAPRILGTG